VRLKIVVGIVTDKVRGVCRGKMRSGNFDACVEGFGRGGSFGEVARVMAFKGGPVAGPSVEWSAAWLVSFGAVVLAAGTNIANTLLVARRCVIEISITAA